MGLVASKDQLKWGDGRTEREGKWDLFDKKRHCDGEVRGDDGAKEQGVWAIHTGENKNRTFANESPMLNCFNEVGQVKGPMIGYNFLSIV